MKEPILVMPMNSNSSNRRLDLERTIGDWDYLVEREGRHFLCVQDQERFERLSAITGPTISASYTDPIYGQALDVKEVQLLRNHPIQYAGQVFQTESGSRHIITPDYRFGCLNRESLAEGNQIEAMAGLDNQDELHYKAVECGYTENREDIKELLSKNGKAIIPGRFIFFSFKEGLEPESKKTSPIKSIRPATPEELARYS